MPQTNLMEVFVDEIERLMDRYGPEQFFSILGYICGERSEKIAPADATKAKIWLKISAQLDKITAEAEEHNL